MTHTDVLQDKSKLIDRINKLFDKKIIEKLSIKHGFVQRNRILKAMDFFFSVYLLIKGKISSALKDYADTYFNEVKKLLNKVFRIVSLILLQPL